ncbi:MAG: hypothetical protein AAFR52_20780 [Pseudomonadota bacterium]
MLGFRDRLWPPGVRLPFLRLTAGLVVAPLAASAVVAVAAYVIAGMTEPTRILVMAVTEDATIAFAGVALVLMVIVVIPCILLFGLLGWRSALVWSLTGLIAGASSAGAMGMAQGAALEVAAPVGGVASVVLLLTTRAVAGIRRSPRTRNEAPDDPATADPPG